MSTHKGRVVVMAGGGGGLYVVVNTIRTVWGKEKGSYLHLLPTGSEGRRLLGMGTIPVAILPSC